MTRRAAMRPQKPRYFATRAAWRAWLQKNHAARSEQWALFYKKHVGRGMAYPEAVEEALCFGWIDGLERRIDDRCHMLRFTPRKPGSTWAPSNIARVKRLIKEKKMTPAGLKVFTQPKHPDRVAPTAASPKSLVMPPDLRRALRTRAAAWKHWQTYPPSFRRIAIWWVRSAKQASTRERRVKNVVSNAVAHPKARY